MFLSVAKTDGSASGRRNARRSPGGSGRAAQPTTSSPDTTKSAARFGRGGRRREDRVDYLLPRPGVGEPGGQDLLDGEFVRVELEVVERDRCRCRRGGCGRRFFGWSGGSRDELVAVESVLDDLGFGRPRKRRGSAAALDDGPRIGPLRAGRRPSAVGAGEETKLRRRRRDEPEDARPSPSHPAELSSAAGDGSGTDRRPRVPERRVALMWRGSTRTP